MQCNDYGRFTMFPAAVYVNRHEKYLYYVLINLISAVIPIIFSSVCLMSFLRILSVAIVMCELYKF